MTSYGQKAGDRITCSEVVQRVSPNWKNDSLTKNRYRQSVYREFLNCTLGGLRMNYLLYKLGQPTRKQRYYNSDILDLFYYYYDYKKMGEGFDGPYGCDYLIFSIDTRDSLVTEIRRGSCDY